MPRRVLVTLLVVTTALLIVAYKTSSTRAAGPSAHAVTTVFTPEPTPTIRPATHPTRTPIHNVVGLGDSVPAGWACSCTTYVSLVANQLASAQNTKVVAENFAQAGETTHGLLAQLQQPALVRALRHAGAVIVTIGANDLEEDRSCSPTGSSACYNADLRALGPTYTQVLSRLHALLPSQAQLVVTGYWNIFEDGQVARQQGTTYVRNSNALTRAVNSLISSTAAANAATYVDLYTPFKGDGDRDDTGLLAGDGDHPNAAGHRIIAAAITRSLVST